MPGGKSDALENEILDHILGGGDFTRPGTLWCALYTATPSDAGGGSEVAVSNYARVPITNDGVNFPPAGGGEKSNGAAITFAKALGPWGVIVAWGLHRHATNDDLTYWGPVSPNKPISTNDTAKFDVGDLVVSED